MNYYQHFAKHAQTNPGQEALILPSRSGKTSLYLSYGELQQQIERYAAGFQDQGMQAGDVVLMLVKPGSEFVCAGYALFYLGAIPLFLDPAMGIRRLLRCIAQAKPVAMIGVPIAYLLSFVFRNAFSTVKKHFITGALPLPGCVTLATLNKYPPIVSPVKDCDDDSLMAVAFTSGSTGTPKGVEWQHGQMSAQINALQQIVNLQPASMELTTFPLSLFISTAGGHRCLLPPVDLSKPGKIPPQLLYKLMLDHQPDYGFASPSLWQNMADYCEKERLHLPSIKAIIIGGAPVSPKLARCLSKLAPEAEIYIVYGATEALPMTAVNSKLLNNQQKQEILPGLLVGSQVPGIALKIMGIDEPDDKPHKELLNGIIGEIYVSGPMVTRQYYQQAKQNQQSKWLDPTTKQLWHKTGDAGYLDDKRQLWFCGRVKHRIKQGLRSLFTVPVETLFNQQPEIRRCALLPHPNLPDSLALVIEIEANWKYAINHNYPAYEHKWQGIAQRHALVPMYFYVHPGLPVDARHNAKVNYEALAHWLQQQRINPA